jgi:hypothetical protein
MIRMGQEISFQEVLICKTAVRTEDSEDSRRSKLGHDVAQATQTLEGLGKSEEDKVDRNQHSTSPRVYSEGIIVMSHSCYISFRHLRLLIPLPRCAKVQSL